MAIPTVYKWTDLNAPVITNSKDYTQIKAWFQAIFVDGYLEDNNNTQKPPLNWNVTTDDTNSEIKIDMVGDPLTENLMRARFHTIPYVSGHNGVKIQVWEHEGTNEIHNASLESCFFWGSTDSATSSTLKICPWIVIGTDRGIYFLSGYNDTVLAPAKSAFSTYTNPAFSVTYIGDYINDGVDLGRNNQCLMGAQPVSHVHPPWRQSISFSYLVHGSKGVKTARNYVNSLSSSELYTYEWLTAQTSAHIFPGAPSRGLKFPYIDGNFYMKEFGLYDKVDRVYFGKMPGLYYPEHELPLATASGLVEFTGSGAYANDSFIGVSGSGEFYINVSQDWGL